MLVETTDYNLRTSHIKGLKGEPRRKITTINELTNRLPLNHTYHLKTGRQRGILKSQVFSVHFPREIRDRIGLICLPFVLML
jgi:hypothetical protein